MLSGVVKQDNAGPNWMMVLPVVMTLRWQPGSADHGARDGRVHAL